MTYNQSKQPASSTTVRKWLNWKMMSTNKCHKKDQNPVQKKEGEGPILDNEKLKRKALSNRILIKRDMRDRHHYKISAGTLKVNFTSENIRSLQHCSYKTYPSSQEVTVTKNKKLLRQDANKPRMQNKRMFLWMKEKKGLFWCYSREWCCFTCPIRLHPNM